MPKLIILRGNSGSGKSTVARSLQERVTPFPVLIEHDYIRRKLLHEKEGPDSINSELIYRMIEYAFENNRDVILEGILRIDWYRPLFEKLLSTHPDDNYFYYFDIPFDETVRRFTTKENSDYTIDDMKRWYKENEQTGYDREIIISVDKSIEEIVEQIIEHSVLSCIK